jgi:hypothetical protein
MRSVFAEISKKLSGDGARNPVVDNDIEMPLDTATKAKQVPFIHVVKAHLKLYENFSRMRRGLRGTVVLTDMLVVVLAVLVAIVSVLCAVNTSTVSPQSNAITSACGALALGVLKLLGLFKFAVVAEQYTVLLTKLQPLHATMKEFSSMYKQWQEHKINWGELSIARGEASEAVSEFDKVVAAHANALLNQRGLVGSCFLGIAAVIACVKKCCCWICFVDPTQHPQVPCHTPVCLFAGYRINFLQMVFMQAPEGKFCLYMAESAKDLEEQEQQLQLILIALQLILIALMLKDLESKEAITTVTSSPVARWYYRWKDGDQGYFDVVRTVTALLHMHEGPAITTDVDSEIKVFKSKLVSWVHGYQLDNDGLEVVVEPWKAFKQRQRAAVKLHSNSTQQKTK